MTQKLDILLINPGAREQVYGKLGSSISGIEPPLWCGLIAGFIREKGYSVKIIDAEAENQSPEETAHRIAEYNPLLAAIIVLGSNPSAASTPKMTSAGETLTVLKKISPQIKTLLGGLHPSALPERTLMEEDVDFVCQGEGFYTILQLLDLLKEEENPEEYKINGLWYIKDNMVMSNPPAPPVKNLDEIPFAAWDLLPMDMYRAHNWHCFDHIDERGHYAVIYTSLGCPFKCNYCNIHALYGKSGIRFRSPEKVIEEIDFLVKNYKIKNIKILDELFVLKEDRVMRICDLIIQRGYKLNIWAYARVDTVNENLMKKMKKAGINWVAFGIESASKNVREGVTKRFSQDMIKKAIEITRAEDVYIMGNFIFGLPDDNMETMQETLDLAKELNLEYINFYTAMAYPGSQLYYEALQKGIKLPEKWHGYSQYGEETLPMPTKYLSAAEVLRFRDNAFKEYFSNPMYMEMIRDKFGEKVVEHIKEMLKHEIHRKFEER
ncbi:MAG: B12-binding domain-containing radical SAM protein [Euryarchaeota archaeon]|nr:B12-binding domain-containing radical SAM protein [Euryarchaeota archaeon]